MVAVPSYNVFDAAPFANMPEGFVRSTLVINEVCTLFTFCKCIRCRSLRGAPRVIDFWSVSNEVSCN